MRVLMTVAIAAVLAACGQPASSGGEAAAQAGGADAQRAFVERCVADLVAQNAEAQRWAPDQCAQDWQKVVAAGDMADAILAGTTLEFQWAETGALIPYDVVGALRARGADVAMIGCSQLGVGEFNKAYRVTASGHAPFALSIYDRTAPTADAESFYNVSANVSGAVPTLAQLRRDGSEWTERCAY